MNSGRNYEFLLLIAYLFGVWNRWHLSELYCDLARFEPAGRDDVPRHEVLFFLAVCLRMQDPDIRRYRQALQLLKEAAHIKARARRDSSYKDPRYLKEEAALIFRWNTAFPASTANEGDQLSPPVTQALELSQQALNLIQDDVTLKVRIYNNLCYHFVNATDAFDRENARDYLNKMIEAQSSIEPNEADWPPSVVDTVVWARWALRGKTFTLAQHQRLVRDLERALARAELTDFQRADMREHLRIIKHALATGSR